MNINHWFTVESPGINPDCDIILYCRKLYTCLWIHFSRDLRSANSRSWSTQHHLWWKLWEKKKKKKQRQWIKLIQFSHVLITKSYSENKQQQKKNTQLANTQLPEMQTFIHTCIMVFINWKTVRQWESNMGQTVMNFLRRRCLLATAKLLNPSSLWNRWCFCCFDYGFFQRIGCSRAPVFSSSLSHFPHPSPISPALILLPLSQYY